MQVKPVQSPLCFRGTSLFLVVCIHVCACVLDKNEPAIVCIHDFKVNGEPNYKLNTRLLLQFSAFTTAMTGN